MRESCWWCVELKAELAKVKECNMALHKMMEAKQDLLEAELASQETKQSAKRGQLYLQIDDLKADNARLRKCLEWCGCKREIS